MYSGRLNEFIEIYRYEKEANAFGEMVEIRHRKYECWAAVGHLGGSRQVLNSEVSYPYQKNFLVRYHVPICENDEIKWNNKFYRVLSIDKDREMQQQTIITQIVNE